MTTFEYEHGPFERAVELNSQLEDFYQIFKPDLRGLPGTPQPGEAALINTIRIRTTSEKKWMLCAALVFYQGLIPVKDAPQEDEGILHERIRQLDDQFPKGYPVRVADAKQSFDTYETPLLTLDTVTYANEMPLEKPHDLGEAKRLIKQISGKQVATDTGWVLGMQVKSGAAIQLLNSTRISYKMRDLSVEEIDHYVQTHSQVLHVPVGIDLSTAPARMFYIDTKAPVTFSAYNSFGETGHLTLEGGDLNISLFNPIFSGVPVHAIRALLPMLDEIYLHGNPVGRHEPGVK